MLRIFVRDLQDLKVFQVDQDPKAIRVRRELRVFLEARQIQDLKVSKAQLDPKAIRVRREVRVPYPP